MASIANLTSLNERRQELHAQIKAMADKEGEWTAQDEAMWAKINQEYDENYEALQNENQEWQNERREDRERRMADMVHKSGEWKNRIGRDGGSLDRPPRLGPYGSQQQYDQQHAAHLRALAIQAWFRAAHDSGEAGPITDQHRYAALQCGINLQSRTLPIALHHDFSQVKNALSSHDGSTGGFTFGDTFVANLERAMLAYGGMMQVAQVIRTTTGEPMRWPTANDTANTGRQLGENQPVTATAQPTFGQVVWNAYKFTSDEILVPFELLRDNVVNLATVLPDMLGERLGRIQNTKYTVGTGAATPYGIVTQATAGVTAASATAIAFDELIDLEHSIDPSRRNMPGVGYMFHDSILLALRKLKDGEGRYLWQAGANTGAPDTLNARPYTVNQDMASSITNSAITVLFGQLTAYKIRQVGSIRLYRLTERHRENDQDAFLAFIEGDGNLLDAGDHPVKKLTQAA